uniref:Uncharacterized protein n=1 Tax=Amphimedon queenslandica TaxID=400682 RepID=A0A1X7T0Q2_AMPQE
MREGADIHKTWTWLQKSDIKPETDRGSYLCGQEQELRTNYIKCKIDGSIEVQEDEKVEKCQELRQEIVKLWGMKKVEVILIVVGALGAISHRISDWLKRLEINIKVCREPIVQESNIQNKSPALVADLAIRGVWSPQSEALLDICVVNTDTQLYLNRSLSDVLAKAEEEKKVKYLTACEAKQALFTPICVSVAGTVGREANAFLKRLGERLSLKWTRHYSEVINWLGSQLTFAII